MTAIELKNTEKIKVFTWQELPLVAWAIVGKAKNPTWQYRFKTVNQRDEYIFNWVEKAEKNLQAREQAKIERRESAKLQRKAEAAKLSETVRVGTFLKREWGATMSRVEWYEVLSIRNNVYSLGAAQFSDDSGGWNGYSTLLGPSDGRVVKMGKLVNGRIAVMRQDGTICSGYWDALKPCKVGDKVHVYCD